MSWIPPEERPLRAKGIQPPSHSTQPRLLPNPVPFPPDVDTSFGLRKLLALTFPKLSQVC